MVLAVGKDPWGVLEVWLRGKELNYYTHGFENPHEGDKGETLKVEEEVLGLDIL